MPLPIETYVQRGAPAPAGKDRSGPISDWRPGNNQGGLTLFKAIGHPLAAERARELMRELGGAGPVAVYDPHGFAAAFGAFYDLAPLARAGVYVQREADFGKTVLGRRAEPVSALPRSGAGAVFVLAFGPGRRWASLAHLAPEGAAVRSLDAIRLPEDMLTDVSNYLDPRNFATNFVLFRDRAGLHTRLTTVNYWGSYGAARPALWCRLHDSEGRTLATWTERLGEADAGIAIDSAAVRARFGLGDFEGSLFVHAIRIAGHDVVKYALDIYGEQAGAAILSSTHDANAWPADLYAGLPAPDRGERVVLWVQNSHPAPIPAGAIAIGDAGGGEKRRFEERIPPFGTTAIDVGRLLPGIRWPRQIEIEAGRYFVRPRYEAIDEGGGRRLAHANVERTDLVPDPRIPALGPAFGKGFLMPLPIPPLGEVASTALPAPMATVQTALPLRIVLYDATGEERAARRLGTIPRAEISAIDIDHLLAEERASLPSGYGHLELLYDFLDGGEADGWLHALGRYERRASGRRADTLFGAHLYNVPVTFENEPQSYSGQPPGLTTRLYLRLGADGCETFCHLIYPVSAAWHARSRTELVLRDADGREVTRTEVRIPMSGSCFWRYHEMFDDAARRRARGGHVIVRDRTCRLFGFQGLLGPGGGFSLDHLFGF